jgi:peptidoglycan/LPS O-acetylase OafA/YrhL
MNLAPPAKRIYLTLEGIRGVAALLIFMRHTGPFMTHLLYHSYLAVDLFFVLSGFVLASAYDRRLADKTLPASTFMKMRFIRLYPLFLLAAVAGLAASLIDLNVWGYHLAGHFAWSPGSPVPPIVSAFLFSLLMLPSFYSRSLYPLNGPAWTLFYELGVNCAYGLMRPFMTFRRLAVVMTILGLVIIARTWVHDDVTVGILWQEMPGGFLHAFYSFGAGLMLLKAHAWLRQHIVPRASNLLCFAILGLAALMLAAPTFSTFDPLYEAIAILFLAPMIVLGASLIEPQALLKSLCTALGRSSYGVYVLHAPVSALIAALYFAFFHARIPVMEASVILLPCLVATALLLDTYVDRPVRALLGRLAFRRLAHNPTALQWPSPCV